MVQGVRAGIVATADAASVALNISAFDSSPLESRSFTALSARRPECHSNVDVGAVLFWIAVQVKKREREEDGEGQGSSRIL